MNKDVTLKQYKQGMYPCKVRLVGDHLCGYVAVWDGHPLYRFNYQAIASDVNVHGGLTYSEMENGWKWFGFDCAHYGDTLEVCNMNYVEDQLLQLVKQLDRLNPEDEKISKRLKKILDEKCFEEHEEDVIARAIKLLEEMGK